MHKVSWPTLLLLAALVSLAGCGELPGVGPRRAPGSLVAGWSAPEGAPDPDSQRGGPHCDYESIVFLEVPWPPGTTREPALEGDRRQYVRDPAEVHLAHDKLLGMLDLDADLPAGSEATGYGLPTAELWLGPDGGDTYAYLLVNDGTAERWPRAPDRLSRWCRHLDAPGA